MDRLHLQGWTNIQIAADLGISTRSVGRDLRLIEQRRLARLTRNVSAERVHSIAVFRQTQAEARNAVEELMNSDPKEPKAIAPLLRTINDAEKAVNAILDSFEKHAAAGDLTVRDLVAEFSPEEVEAFDPTAPDDDDHTDGPHAARAATDEDDQDADEDPDGE